LTATVFAAGGATPTMAEIVPETPIPLSL